VADRTLADHPWRVKADEVLQILAGLEHAHAEQSR
jgi:hypothetical protein